MADYRKKLNYLLNDPEICKENKKLYREFFKKEVYKLKRKNGIDNIDEGCNKTLLGYISRIKNINMWFNNKPLTKLTKQDIKKVYDGLEDGTIVNRNGTKFQDRKSYYHKVFKSTLFEMAGKIDLTREVMEYYSPKKNNEVRFITEKDVKEIISVMISPKHRLLGWIAFDIGENINSLLRLKKADCIRQINEDTKQAEYHIILDKEILKRTRTPRTEITNYPETVEMLDIILKNMKDEEPVFGFKYSMAKKTLDRAVKITSAKCQPKGQKVTWKDLRSSMACDLLKKGWSRDEVNARLGHKPSSTEIDKYINFLALDRRQPKKKIFQHNMEKLQEELNQTKENEKLQSKRIYEMQEKMERQQKEMENRLTEMQSHFMKTIIDLKPEKALKKLNYDMIQEIIEANQKKE